MFPTPLARLNLDIAAAIRKTLPKNVLPAIRRDPANLFQVLSRHATVEDKIVHQIRWSEKGIAGCWWSIKRAQFKDDGNHGKAWGYKYWKGVRVSPHPERIRGGLKYKWIEGKSVGKLLTKSS